MVETLDLDQEGVRHQRRAAVDHDKAGLQSLDRPGRREAAGRINATGNAFFSYGRSAGSLSVQPTAAALSPDRPAQGPADAVRRNDGSAADRYHLRVGHHRPTL